MLKLILIAAAGLSTAAFFVPTTGDSIPQPQPGTSTASMDESRVPRIGVSGGPDRVRTCDRSVMSRLL